MAAIFGSNSSDILHTGDEVADKNIRESFERRYERMHRVVIEPDQTAAVYRLRKLALSDFDSQDE